MVRTYKNTGRNRRRKGGIIQAVLKNLVIIVSACLLIKFSAVLGADKLCSRFFADLLQNKSVISNILSFEMGHRQPNPLSVIQDLLSEKQESGSTSAAPEKDISAENQAYIFPVLPNGESGGISQSNTSSSASEMPENVDLTGAQLMAAAVSGEIKDASGYNIDFSKYLSERVPLSTDFSNATVLIIHTHGCEAYKAAGSDIYKATDPSRTEDRSYNMIRVGDELTAVLRARGVNVIHDTALYDYPSYNGSYTRSLNAITSYLEKDPTIKIVIDLHRDAAGSNSNPYKTTVNIGGETTSQVMIIAGTNGSGLWHPNWEENLKFALLLQGSMNLKYPSLARPLYVTNARYNQHATTGSLLVEVGYNGNTLQEAIGAVKYFGDSMADVVNLLKSGN